MIVFERQTPLSFTQSIPREGPLAVSNRSALQPLRTQRLCSL